MIAFDDQGSQVLLVYQPDNWGPATWIDHKLNHEGSVTLSRTFTVRKKDMAGESSPDVEQFVFVIGEVADGYRRIRADVLGLKHDLLLAESIRLERKVFVAEQSISIFRQLDDLVSEQIVVGENLEDAIPEDEFRRLLWDFPTTTELRHYTRSRISRVLREYLETMSDAERRLATYMERRALIGTKAGAGAHGRIPIANALELEKFTYVQDRLVEMLKDADSYSEADWQAAVADLFLLVFPQYVAVLHHVRVKERYSNESRSTDRYIDLMLVGANGCADIIEIKRPCKRSLVSRGRYRDNHVPVRELSGSIMQAEKYLFYLSKSGRDGEKDINKRHAATLPAGLEVKIANPKAIILTGRDDNLSTQEKLDFEFIRRKYSNVVDIISYDDLLRRLDNIVAALTARTGPGGSPATDDAAIGESA